MLLGRIINAFQKFWSKDNESKYSHSGFMLDSQTSFEALWMNKKQDFFKAYGGRNVLIGRNKKMTPIRFREGWRGIKHHEGKPYAGHRLFFFMIPFVAKYCNLGLAVCSELTMKFLFKTGLAGMWQGWNPDDVADMIRKWKNWDIVFEGRLPKNP
jgi:hypothetical protein